MTTLLTSNSFIHGGTPSFVLPVPYESDLANVFVLTMPQFIWKRIPSSIASMRASPSCDVINGQLLIVGGDDPTITGLNQDPWQNGIGIFDMNSLAWASGYTHDHAPYTRNMALESHAGNSPVDYTPLASSLFLAKASDSTASSAGGAPSDEPSGGPNVGAIAGGTIGGVLVLALAGLGVWFWLRRQRKTRAEKEQLLKYGYEEKQDFPDTYEEHSHELQGGRNPAQEMPSVPKLGYELHGGPELAHELDGSGRR